MILKRDYKQVQTQHAQLIFTAFSSSCLLCNSHPCLTKPVTWMGSQWQGEPDELCHHCGFSLTIMWPSCWEKHLLENDHWIPFHQGDCYSMASVALWDTLEATKCLLWMSLLVGKNILFFKMLLMVYSNGNQDRTFFSSESKPAY